jgi:hypothetical protein
MVSGKWRLDLAQLYALQLSLSRAGEPEKSPEFAPHSAAMLEYQPEYQSWWARRGNDGPCSGAHKGV